MVSIRTSVLSAALVGLVLASGASAATVAAVDFNGSAGTPTSTGYTGFTIAQPSATTSLTSGSVTIAVNPNASTANGASLTSRDRGAQGSATTTADSDFLRDFALVTRDTGHALGYTYLSISISGLTANTTYSFVGTGLDPNSVGATGNREGFSSVVPTEYAPGSAPAASSTLVYTPQFVAPTTIAAASAPALSVTSDASGVATVYAFADATSYSNQTATIVNGFTLSTPATPEPAALSLVGLGGLVGLRRRRA